MIKLTKARGRVRHTAGVMNKLEAAYSASLSQMVVAGEIDSFMFESMKLVLADRTSYMPDFLVFNKDGFIEFHEVKGFWESAARIKIKVAAKMFPQFQFKAFTRKRGMWIEEGF